MKREPFPSISEPTAEKMVAEWLDVIKRQECAVIIFPPKGDAYRRIEQLLMWDRVKRKNLGKSYKKCKLVAYSMLTLSEKSVSDVVSFLSTLVDTQTSSCHTPTELLFSLQKELKTYQSISFLLYDTDNWFREKQLDILKLLAYISETDPRIQFLLFCETDITAPDLLVYNTHYTTLVQNIFTYPYYSVEDALHFIDSLAKYWNSSVPEVSARQIVEKVGTHTWLIKEAVRLYLKEHKIPPCYLNYPTILIRLERLWQQLTDVERIVLLKTVSNQKNLTLLEKNSALFLERVGVLTRQQDQLEIRLPVWAEFIKDKQFGKTLKVTEKRSLLAEGQLVDHLFGRHERIVLVKLVEDAGKIVERESLASVLWPTADYSDWALDRILSRVRQKLRKIGVNPDHIKTVKKVGFLWE